MEAHSDRPPSEGFDALMARIVQGSDEAVWELLDRYSKNILRVVRRSLPNQIRQKIDSVDIVQSVWKSYLRKGGTFRQPASAEEFVAYLAGMARFKVLENYRHFTQVEGCDVRKERSFEPVGQSPINSASPKRFQPIDRKTNSPSSIARAKETWAAALDKEGPAAREIVHLRLQGLTYDEIVQRVGLPKSAVRRTLNELLQSLTS